MIEITKNQINLIENSKAIGHIIYDDTPNFIVASHIYVAPEERGKGHTKTLMDAFIKLVLEKNKKVKATCSVMNRFLTESNPELLI